VDGEEETRAWRKSGRFPRFNIEGGPNRPGNGGDWISASVAAGAPTVSGAAPVIVTDRRGPKHLRRVKAETAARRKVDSAVRRAFQKLVSIGQRTPRSSEQSVWCYRIDRAGANVDCTDHVFANHTATADFGPVHPAGAVPLSGPRLDVLGPWRFLFSQMGCMKEQRNASLFDVLRRRCSPEITPESPRLAFIAHINELPGRVALSFLVNRVVAAGSNIFAFEKSAGRNVHDDGGSQSEIDANKRRVSYTILKVFIWGVAILVAIGTVMGVRCGRASFGGSLSGAATGCDEIWRARMCSGGLRKPRSTPPCWL